MLKGSEATTVWSGLKKEFDTLRWAYQRIELKAMFGVPDVNVHVPAIGDVWIELKFVRALGKTEQHPVELGLRKEQYNWMTEHQRAGRKVLLVAKVGTNWYVWSDARAWELAKHPTPWCELARLGYRCWNAGTVCTWIEGNAQWR